MMFPILRNYVFNGSSYYYDSNRYPALAEFMEGSYAQLLYLPEMFSYDSDKPTFTMIANDFAHDYTILREDYSFGTIDGKHKAAGTGTRSQQKGPYHVNTAVYLKLAQFFETMKEKGVYDNTRIIIVSDHGYAIDVPAFEQYDNGKDMASFNPVMLVKDYNTTGKPVTDYKLVTNADLVNFAREGIISSDRNPYTGNTFMSSDDFDSFNVYRMDNWWTEDYQKEYRYPIKDKVAYTVTDNIFDPDNWKRIDTSVIKE